MPRSRSSLFSVVNVIILINVVIYYKWATAGEAGTPFMEDHFLVSWQALSEGRWWVLLTSVFSHLMFLHLLVNMLVLKSFGRILEMLLGPGLFIVFYLAAGIFSSFCHAALSAFLLHAPEMPALGASGAISGLVVLFCLLFPKEKLYIFALIPAPAYLAALALVGLDLWGLEAQARGGGLPIGHGAHLGGALFGLLFYFLYLRGSLRRRKMQSS